VILGPAPTESARTTFDQAIADGKLQGVNIQTLPQIAALDAKGLNFIRPRAR